MKMLEVFIRKFQTIAKHHIPAIMAKCEPAPDAPSKDQTASLAQSAAEGKTSNNDSANQDDDLDDDGKKSTLGQNPKVRTEI